MVIFRENTEDLYSGIEFEQGTEDNRRFLDILKDALSANTTPASAFPATSGIGIKNISQRGHRAAVTLRDRVRPHQQAQERHHRAQGQHPEVHRRLIPRLVLRAGRARVADRVYTWPQWERTKAASGEKAANEEQSAALKNGKLLIKDAIADITLQQVLTRADEFDVIATMNLNGDYLSDALAAQVGGIGIAPGANINYVYRSRGIRGHARHGAEVRGPRSGQPGIGDPVGRDDAALHRLAEAADAIMAPWIAPSARRP